MKNFIAFPIFQIFLSNIQKTAILVNILYIYNIYFYIFTFFVPLFFSVYHIPQTYRASTLEDSPKRYIMHHF